MKVLTHFNQILTLENAHAKDGRHLVPDDLSLINDGAIVFDDEKIIWVGKTKDLPSQYHSQAKDMTGFVLTPELVDSHTHLVFGGDRAQEYTDRLNGTSYEEIAKRGGGILLSMKKTNEASLEDLFKDACEKIERIHSYGVGTIEVKSGYGLNFEKEYELSLLIDRLKQHFGPRVQIFNTYLAAHDVPRTFRDSAHYMDEVVIPLLEKLVSLNVIDAVDIFHEKNYFTEADTRKLFEKAKEFGIPRKIHADELNDNGGASLAASFDALSADHLLKISDQGIEDLAHSTTIATILPGTAFFLGKPLAPARKLLDAGARVAIASDYNPGSCHCDNLLLIASLCAAQTKINQTELWAAITLNAAAALGLSTQGALVPGMRPRFSLFKVQSLSHLTYNWGRNFCVTGVIP